jgi:hypothetical protein
MDEVRIRYLILVPCASMCYNKGVIIELIMPGSPHEMGSRHLLIPAAGPSSIPPSIGGQGRGKGGPRDK